METKRVILARFARFLMLPQQTCYHGNQILPYILFLLKNSYLPQFYVFHHFLVKNGPTAIRVHVNKV